MLMAMLTLSNDVEFVLCALQLQPGTRWSDTGSRPTPRKPAVSIM